MRYEEPSGPLQGRRRRLVALAAVLVLGAAGAVGLSGAGGDGSEPVPAAAGDQAAGRPAPATAGPSADPLVTARNWLDAYRTIRYTDPAPTTWTQRLAPLLTDPARTEVAQQAGAGSAGASWQRFTTQRCTAQVTDTDAVVPPEAPRTATTVFVQVTGVVTTVCPAAVPPTDTGEQVSATLELHQAAGTAPGQIPGQTAWLVARRMF